VTRPRVALLIETGGPGGAEVMLLHLAEGLRARGYDVVPVLPEKGERWLHGQFGDRGFEPLTFDLTGPFDRKCVRRLAELVRRHDLGVLHAHEFSLGVFGAAAARLTGRPLVMTMHGGLRYTRALRRRLALGWAARSSRAVVGVSKATAETLERSLWLRRGSVHVVPNGIMHHPGSPERVRRELGLADDERLVVSVGSLYPVKGHIVLLRAAAELAKREPALRWRIAIAGRGQEEPRLREFVRDAGLESRVHLLGLRGDVPDLLAAADVYAMPSLSEGLPIALLEAMFAEKAIVASYVGGIPEVIEAGVSGELVPPSDPDALATALAGLLGDDERRRRLGAAAAERARAGYSVEAMVERYERLYGLA
jgi:glycosyltransferase involved in cell wall biosynthesis